MVKIKQAPVPVIHAAPSASVPLPMAEVVAQIPCIYNPSKHLCCYAAETRFGLLVSTEVGTGLGTGTEDIETLTPVVPIS